ncbi:type IV pilus secretin PilQ [Neptunomonas antarctica]|uniref:Type IV pilus assembly protein PilQ n=1 Tax=Neptunomonas antarctica TaxID=619304 RepID=A0A1N7J310_9GAMM|nr:type IV pilus secretin PilQ [Neptunomonas antarctica]SIS43755.1 type IV pilus assembly protein PilQ [Neptunomonas antarctica]
MNYNNAYLQPHSAGLFNSAIITILLLMLLGTLSQRVSAQEVALQKSSFVALPGNKIEVKLDFDSAPPVPKAYTIDSPPRLVLDFWGVNNELGTKSVDVKSGVVESLSFAQGSGRLRIVTNLHEMTSYRTFTEGNSLFVVFGEKQNSVAATGTLKKMSEKRSLLDAHNDKTRVQGIDFERVDGGVGRVVITLSDDQAGLDIQEEGNNVAVNFSGATLSAALQQRVNVQDFATPVMFIDAMASGRNTTVLIKPGAEPYDYMAYQTGNKLILDFKPLTRAEKEEAQKNDFPYSGEKIDLNFQNVSVRSVLQILAEVAQLNLVVDDAVGGEITLRLKHVPWDQALDIVMKTRGLDKRQVGNVLLIAPAEDIAERERIELESQKQVEELSPLKTDYIQVDYRKASEMKSRIYEAKLVSERGFIVADDQTNVLMVRETATQLEEIRRTLRKFDTEVAQIMVEARLVTASTDFSRELGITWGFGREGNKFTIGGAGATGTNLLASGVSPLNVDLGVAGNSAIRIGYATSDFLISSELSALQSEGKAEIISQPKIITTNGKAARIQSGQQIPYQTVEDGEVKIEFKDVVLSLDVTPQLNPGDRITLDLKITQDSIGGVATNGEIIINNNELETSVVVKDGETIVLGGVYSNEVSDDVDKTPFFGDLPGIGALFRQTRVNDKKVELLIFITPKLIRESLSAK